MPRSLPPCERSPPSSTALSALVTQLPGAATRFCCYNRPEFTKIWATSSRQAAPLISLSLYWCHTSSAYHFDVVDRRVNCTSVFCSLTAAASRRLQAWEPIRLLPWGCVCPAFCSQVDGKEGETINRVSVSTHIPAVLLQSAGARLEVLPPPAADRRTGQKL